MKIELDPAEVRVLGALVEKQVTTPEYYPLTLNALVNACNQKSNRDPATHYGEREAIVALESLRGKTLATMITGPDHRVPKYAHLMDEMLDLGPDEVAILCELMVRGPQTPGELRSRASRMHAFAGVEAVEATLAALSSEGGVWRPLTVKLPRQPGRKEARWAHLLSGMPEMEEAEEHPRTEPAAERLREEEARIARLEEDMSALRAEMDALKQTFEAFRRQFE